MTADFSFCLFSFDHWFFLAHIYLFVRIWQPTHFSISVVSIKMSHDFLT
jgi:hypothetical protein